MRIWGYILVVLNIGAAGAFVYLALMVNKQKREWTAAEFRAEMLISGLSVEKPEKPDDLEDDFVAFHHMLDGVQEIDQLPKSVLKRLIPTGGAPNSPVWPFGAGPDEIVASQSEEVERIRKKFFDDQIPKRKEIADLRQFLRTYLINFARSGAQRDGINALLRDYPDKDWRDEARKDLPYLARTGMQRDALRALVGIAPLDDELVLQKPEKVSDARKAIRLWAEKYLSYAIPKPLPNSSGIRSEAAMAKYADDLKSVDAALQPLLTEADAVTPDAARLNDGKTRIVELADTLTGSVADGDAEPLKQKKREWLKSSLEFLAGLSGNPLKTKEAVAEARKQLVDLVQARAALQSEKAALAGVADLIMPPPLDAKLEPADLEKEKQRRIDESPSDVAKLLLKQHFEEAAQEASKTRGDVLGFELRDPGEKRSTVAHLLYNLDAHLYAPKPTDRKPWHERVVAIIGYVAYLKTAEEQASALYDMGPRIASLELEEQTAFEAEYQLLLQISTYLALREEQVAQQLAEQKALKVVHEVNVAARKQEQTDLNNEWVAEQAKTKAALTELKLRQAELFRITKELGEAQDALVGLEEKLRVLERSFVKPSPRSEK